MMARTKRSSSGSSEPAMDPDLLAGLWQEAPFPRLPPDAPPSFQYYVQDIESPSRVYAIHKASRRHDFQQLVERYVVQLRNGCGQSNCETPTCFSCRRRLAGRAPIRRYNTTSARTLAVYLASQDDPYDGLCPALLRPKDPPAAVGTLIFSKRPSSPTNREVKGPNSHQPNRQKLVPDLDAGRLSQGRKPRQTGLTTNSSSNESLPSPRNISRKAEISITEQQVSKDHRSFAANVFGTFAFKMLEWLTPRGLEAMSQQVSRLHEEPQAELNPSSDQDEPVSSQSSIPPSFPSSQGPGSASGQSPSKANGFFNDDQDGRSTGLAQPDDRFESQSDPSPAFRDTKTRSGRKSKPHTTPPPKQKRTASLDPLLSSSLGDDVKPALQSPRLNGFHNEKLARPLKSNPTVISGRGIPEIPSCPPFFENVPSPNPSLPQKKAAPEPFAATAGVAKDGPGGRRSDLDQRTSKQGHGGENHNAKSQVPKAWLRNALPQSLTRLSVESIEFICNVFHEDDTAEQNISFTNLGRGYPKPQNMINIHRKGRSRQSASAKRRWKRFNEQSLFWVLSDPTPLVASLNDSDRGELYDSHTLWYCFYRMTRAAPTTVYHSLWIAADGLFPQRSSDLSWGYSKAKNPPVKLSKEALGRLMSICLHALVAAVPIVEDPRTLYELSRIRANGFAVPSGVSVARQPPSRCLEYDDAFSNDLASRLARRVFTAVAVHDCLAELEGRHRPPPTIRSTPSILQLFVNQLDFLSTENRPYLRFSHPERLQHEARVPTVLLDWARTVMLMEWDGRPDFSGVSPFGGALTFIKTMYENRNLLLLGDIQFRVDFLSDRLDSIDLPVDWLSFNSSAHRRHILDYPFIFNPEILITFFRSINFARMSRMFEESSSLKTRMSSIVDPGSLIANPHHKTILHDLLGTASSKYLILEIRRQHLVTDAFDQLWRRERRELLRPLKVHLGEDDGEEGFDSGGVQQEFFRLAIAECLDPSYGAFTVDERTRMAWFSPGSITEEWKFELVGVLVSLALYNGLTLPVTFPRALYRKLLGRPVEELHHIADGWPDLASGLTTLLEWDEKDGLVEDVFARTYEFSVSAFGSNVTREMSTEGTSWPRAAAGSGDEAPPHMANPEDAPLVTNQNRDTYVSDYIRYLTDVSIRPQFLAFQRGFHSCLDGKSLSLLTPPTLQSLVEGVEEIDISELRRYTRYVGWDATHHTVKDFWSVVKKYDNRMKRRLLEFVTSSDRVPVGGIKSLQFVVQKNGTEEGAGGHLPTAYTCYGTLLLPEYRDKEVLKERLGMALENAQGFGFA